MSLPINLILVRHGESEGNVATRASENGDNSFFTSDFLNRHSRTFRLTDRGISQAKSAGEWLRKNIPFRLEYHYVSDYMRAKETAYYLSLEEAMWRSEFQLRERDMALMDNIPRDERAKLFGLEHQMYLLDPFFSIPAGGGESFAALCLRLKADFLDHLARDRSGNNVIVVCHGHVMRALQFEIEHLGHDDFDRLDTSKDLKDKIRNCQIVWYSRVDPSDRTIGNRFLNVRSVCPWDENGDYGWRKINRKLFSNEELFKEVESYPRIVNV